MVRKDSEQGQQDHGDDPSPEEIAELCRRIQDGWSELQEITRRLSYGDWQKSQKWTAPEVASPRDRFGERMG